MPSNLCAPQNHLMCDCQLNMAVSAVVFVMCAVVTSEESWNLPEKFVVWICLLPQTILADIFLWPLFIERIVQIKVTRGIPEKNTVSNSDFLIGHGNKNTLFCVEVISGCEKLGDVPVHAFPQTNVCSVLFSLFTSNRQGLQFPS